MDTTSRNSFEILACQPVWTETDEPEFDHRMVILREGDQYFFGRDPRRKGDIDPTQIPLTAIPISHFRAPFPTDLTIAPDFPLDLKSIFIKEPNLLTYGHCSFATQQSFYEPQLQEARVYEQLRQAPHPNIGVYYGCAVIDGRIKGLCLKRYKQTLAMLLRDQSLDYNEKQAIMEDIKRGVAHLHSLNLVHGDINLSNIMVDGKDSSAVLIDFDSCRPKGEPMGPKAGTMNWGGLFPDVAHIEHDLNALKLIEERLFADS
ncbi:hypothetical protein V2G26_021284 [Clonostachys chloroleuca]